MSELKHPEKPSRRTDDGSDRLSLATHPDALATYLKDRRAKLDPAAFGIATARRRTPGLRREEVAQRAKVSVTWYTWLEQGRGGAPSADVLERLAGALALTPAEREHLFLLAQHRPPEVKPPSIERVTPQLQRVLDSLEFTPALVKNALWDIVAWNAAATAVLMDYAALPPARRNILRLMFGEPRLHPWSAGWEAHARMVVATFRAETVRAGVTERVRPLVDEISAASPAFRAMWQEYAVRNDGQGRKVMRHPRGGTLALEFSSFAVEGHPGLSLTMYTPATAADREGLRALINAGNAKR